MPEYDARLVLHTGTVTAWDCECPGLCRGKASEEHVPGTRFAFPYRGVYVHSVGTKDHVADANQMVITNADEAYRVSHPVAGGDATLTLAVDAPTLLEVTPLEYRCSRERPALNRSLLRIDPRTQLLAAQLRQRLLRESIDRLEAETQVLHLIRHALGSNASHSSRPGSRNPEKMADQVKMLLSADPWRRWTLATIAEEVSVTPVYLTDAFRRVEGIPLYRYHLQLRLAFGLTVLPHCDDLMALAIDLGFHSHSHFSASFKKTFGHTPSEFKRSVADRSHQTVDHQNFDAKLLDSAGAYVSRSVCDACHSPSDVRDLQTSNAA
ncbi:AraC family transcriptional regulator [Mycobacterium numidiamassiliense]|jgi:AraC-like DNA-binding protein|uniref:AraC family transcriptional regulator n=1 Tax=Mycobacterium numidiamassiliense TaxID=1841861 RepID=A0A2U3PHH3_9MYCO|nr:AraC family transcriptional regulator [Mycobacterium numidiamassiliense]SPM43218.1 AraC family transcriptional regulator [Mycobacterium numidiamassiliense]